MCRKAQFALNLGLTYMVLTRCRSLLKPRMKAGAWYQDHVYLVKLKGSTGIKQIGLLATRYNLIVMEECQGQKILKP